MARMIMELLEFSLCAGSWRHRLAWHCGVKLRYKRAQESRGRWEVLL